MGRLQGADAPHSFTFRLILSILTGAEFCPLAGGRPMFRIQLPDAEVERLGQVLRTATKAKRAAPKLADDVAPTLNLLGVRE
jgi:hypothetical protein